MLEEIKALKFCGRLDSRQSNVYIGCPVSIQCQSATVPVFSSPSKRGFPMSLGVLLEESDAVQLQTLHSCRYLDLILRYNFGWNHVEFVIHPKMLSIEVLSPHFTSWAVVTVFVMKI